MIELIIQCILLLIGFLCLIKGSDIFVDGSSNVASLLKIPTLIVGLTIVAFGTSMPEASVSIMASLNGSNAIAVTNVIGSNIFNILLIIGVCATLTGLKLKKTVIKRDIPFLVAITFLLIIFILIARWQITQIQGSILLLLIIIYVYFLVREAKNSKEISKPKFSLTRSIIYIIIGLIAIIIGGELVVNSATYIALACGISETLVGLTIVAIGTSLPELVTSLTALKKGETDIIIGNVIGSNIFNTLFVLGASSALSTITLDPTLLTDLLLLLVITIICFIFAKTGTKFDKKEGIILLIIFIAYMIFIIFRN